MYKIPDEDTIKEEIIPCLSIGKRGFKITGKIEEVVMGIMMSNISWTNNFIKNDIALKEPMPGWIASNR